MLLFLALSTFATAYAGETRYLKIGTMSYDAAEIRFTSENDRLVIKSGIKEILRVDASINKIRVILKDRTAYFIDATKPAVH